VLSPWEEDAFRVASEGATTAEFDDSAEVRDNGLEAAVHAFACGGEACEEFHPVGGEQFSGGTGGGGAEVGGEVGDGEIDFVADGIDDGDGAGVDGAGDDFLVEGPEVFDAAAAAGRDDGIDAGEAGTGGAAEHVEGIGDFPGGSDALHADGSDEDVEPWGASSEDIEHVLKGGSGRGSDDGHHCGHGGDRLLAVGIEEAFGSESAFEGVELELE